MQVNGPNFGNYDARYLQVTRREHAQSVKPNVFRGVDDSVAEALQLTSDVVALSGEAQELMRLLKKYGKHSQEVMKYLNGKNVKKLIYSFKELRDLVYGEDEEEEEDENDPTKKKKKKKQKGEPAQPNQYYYQLSPKPREGGARPTAWSPLRELIDKMIVFCQDDAARKKLVLELEPMGEEIIKTVKQFGTRIIVLPRNQSLTQIKIKGMSVVSPGERSFDGRPWDMVRGLYDNSRRIIVIGEENIGRNRSTARHEFAHAFDHTFSQKNNRRLPLSVQLWNLFGKERKGLISDYAATNPAEYFAEAVEAYFRSDGRDQLIQDDPKMYQYLQNLFGRQ